MQCAFSASDLPEPIHADPAEMTRSSASNVDAAFSIVLNPGPGISSNLQALAAFRRAAARWEAVISDPITVTIDVDIVDIPSGAIGQTLPRQLAFDLGWIRDLIAADGTNERADSITASLPLETEVQIAVPPGAAPDGFIVITKANMKALGFDVDTPFGPVDGSIMFSTALQPDFDFNSADGVGSRQIDFETAATHEIGHLLGFTSAVDLVAQRAAAAAGSMRPAAVSPTPLDLYRFAAGATGNPDGAEEFAIAVRNLVEGAPAVFDDGVHELALSTGRQGDGRQASHWRDHALTGILLGVMDPTLAIEESIPITAADLRALDLIGWEILAAEALPSVTARSPAVVESGAPVQLRSIADDADGLGFPVFAAFGSPGRISFLWDFQTGTPSDPLAFFAANPVVTFELPEGAPTTVFRPSVTGFDFLGDFASDTVEVMVSTPPVLEVRTDGRLADFVEIPANKTVSFAASASDSDGLGFPVFAAFGSSNPITFVWDFGGGTPLSPLDVFSASPRVRFAGDRGDMFNVSVVAFDALGLSTKREVIIAIVNEPPAVSLRVNGTEIGGSTGTPENPIVLPADGIAAFSAAATDSDGLGFPVFSAFGSDNPITFLWDFGGGAPRGPLDSFFPSPIVRFSGGPGSVFTVSLAVFDRLGNATNVSVSLRTAD